MLTARTSTTLFCKPATGKGVILHQEQEPVLGTFEIRSLDLQQDLDMIHDWVNREYAQAFWQLKGSKKMIGSIYASILDNPDTHSFIGLLNKEPICQVDVYRVLADELCKHIDADDNDCGLHFLMAPLKVKKAGVSVFAFKSFLRYYFCFDEAVRMFGEPDSRNEKANKLVRKVGFAFLKTISLSYKTANLYHVTRETL